MFIVFIFYYFFFFFFQAEDGIRDVAVTGVQTCALPILSLPLNLIPTNSFSFTYARPGKLTGVQVHYTASPRVDLWGVVVNGWDVTVDNNRGKTGLARIQLIPIPWVTLGFTGVYGPDRDSSDASQRSLVSRDPTTDR